MRRVMSREVARAATDRGAKSGRVEEVAAGLVGFAPRPRTLGGVLGPPDRQLFWAPASRRMTVHLDSSAPAAETE